MMGPWRLIVRTLLAVPQITTLALDLVDRAVRILNIGHERPRDPTRIRVNGAVVARYAHDSYESEDGGVQHAGR